MNDIARLRVTHETNDDVLKTFSHDVSHVLILYGDGWFSFCQSHDCYFTATVHAVRPRSIVLVSPQFFAQLTVSSHCTLVSETP